MLIGVLVLAVGFMARVAYEIVAEPEHAPALRAAFTRDLYDCASFGSQEAA